MGASRRRWLGGLLGAAMASSATAQPAARVLDAFDAPAQWSVIASNQVSGALRAVDGVDGRALCLDYDFNGVSGYVGMQRELPMAYPADYAFSFQLRGDSPANDLQFKLIDASGDNVWWVNQPGYEFPAQWTPVRYKKRQISRAWGPAPDPLLRRSQKLEFTIANSTGGKGSVCFDTLVFQPRLPDDGSALLPSAKAAVGNSAKLAVDGKLSSAWHGQFDDPPGSSLTLDLGRVREFGGLSLQWSQDFASDYAVDLSDDGRQWRPAQRVKQGNGGRDWIALPESEARYLRLTASSGPGKRFALAEATIEPLAFAATSNAFIAAVAQAAGRGQYPRGFIGEQPYWTIVGIDGGDQQGLIGEDGAIEVAKGGFSIEPFVISDGKLLTWADVQTSQSLQDGYLPIPSVAWRHPDFKLVITAFAQGRREHSQLVARYRLSNSSTQARDYTLALALQPFQVNPPSQFLNTTGGVSPIKSLAVSADEGRVDGSARLHFLQRADSAFATTFAAGMAVEHLRLAPSSPALSVSDDTGLASAAWRYQVHLAPGESREFAWIAPLAGDLPESLANPAAAQAAVASEWRDKLNQVTFRLPSAGQPLLNSLRSAQAYLLISRNGPRLQPGTRSYARAWIRDGAMISDALLRLGRADVAEQFLRWYAPYQFDNGKVPCCVDDRGSDPVPENDSHGELLFTVAEVYRYRRERKLLEDMWPHVVGAVKYMDQLRLSERTEANRARNRAFYGMMPASISHEGYSAKPMHSYWDNFWALRGYKDAVLIAQWLGHDQEAKRFAQARDQFRADLAASIESATRQHRIDFIPGAAELGDFDPTSTTIALAPVGEQERLPQALLRNTFERYWREFIARRDGGRQWKDYTPYELRTIGSFIRLGWRDRAQQALAFFLADQQPRAWNQWAEVVSRTPRTPFFLGDLPHAWVESDFARSVLDMFAFTRDSDEALVIAAGLPSAWLQGDGVAVSGLRTPYGELGYSLRQQPGRLRLQLQPGLKLPPGGIVLQLPAELTGGKVRINGRPAAWRTQELHIDHVPAEVLVETP